MGSLGHSHHLRHFNPRPPCGGRPPGRIGYPYYLYNFNPRPPCGGRQASPICSYKYLIFQSTPPVRGATLQKEQTEIAGEISIHAPRAGGDNKPSIILRPIFHFNPRPPCGGRLYKANKIHFCYLFQSTPPVRGATKVRYAGLTPTGISIHAPRAGGDGVDLIGDLGEDYFNPRPPCGGRRVLPLDLTTEFKISIHAPRAGGDKIR